MKFTFIFIPMRIESTVRLDFKDVLFRPKRSTLSSRAEVDLSRTFTFRNSKSTWSGVPIVASNMDTTGTVGVAAFLEGHKMFTCLHKHHPWEDLETHIPKLDPSFYAVSIGIGEKDMEYLDRFMTSFPMTSFICLDVANGYQESFVSAVKDVRTRFPSQTIIAGNVVTGEMVEELILAGADIVKVGIGSGSVCSTRLKTGVGYPQLSAVMECADAAHGLGGHIMSDGGCKVAGDVSKAFGAGADFCMLGGMFSGYDESGGEDICDEDGRVTHKLFYGMSSDTAMTMHRGGVASYRASEGITVKVPYRGPMMSMVYDLLGGVRSTCTYVGARSLKELTKRTTFVRVTQQVNPTFHTSS